MATYGGGGGGGSSFAAADITNLSSNSYLGTSNGWAIVAFTMPPALIVNSTAITQNAQQAIAGVCDTTPGTAQQTCTLPQAIEVSNQLGGRTIGFDIPGSGVPVISSSTGMPALSAPSTIDGSTQPGAHVVEINGDGVHECCANRSPAQHVIVGLRVRGSAGGSTIRGMDIHGFSAQIDLQGGSNTIQGNLLGTDPTGQIPQPNDRASSQDGIFLESSGNQIGGTAPAAGNVISGNDDALNSADSAGIAGGGSGNVIDGNTIGAARGHTTWLLPPGDPLPQPKFPEPVEPTAQYSALDLSGNDNTVGGSQPGAGNVIVGGGSTVAGNGDVIQGNRIKLSLEVGYRMTVGGATSTPGTAPGNDFAPPYGQLDVAGSGTVVQGNHFHGASNYAIRLRDGDHATVGGAKSDLGNLIDANSTGAPVGTGDIAGIAIGYAIGGGAGSDNTIENNQINSNGGDGGVAVYEGTGNAIVNNTMSANTLGINLGGGPFHYNTINPFSEGPNHFQFYPNLLGSTEHGTGLHVSGQLDDFGHGHASFTIDLYAQRGCTRDSVTPGQGEHMVAEQKITTDRLGQASFLIDVRSSALGGARAFTATATSGDGSTSEFSPCLNAGRQALGFTGAGVIPTSTNVPITTAASAASDNARSAAAKGKHHPPTGTVDLLCPPRTTGTCSGTFTLTTVLRRKTITLARGRMKIRAGFVDAITFKVSSALLAELKHRHRHGGARLTIVARDGAKHHKTHQSKLTLVYIG